VSIKKRLRFLANRFIHTQKKSWRIFLLKTCKRTGVWYWRIFLYDFNTLVLRKVCLLVLGDSFTQAYLPIDTNVVKRTTLRRTRTWFFKLIVVDAMLSLTLFWPWHIFVCSLMVAQSHFASMHRLWMAYDWKNQMLVSAEAKLYHWFLIARDWVWMLWAYQ